MKIPEAKIIKKTNNIAKKMARKLGGDVEQYMGDAKKEALEILELEYPDVDGLKRVADDIYESVVSKTVTLYFENVCLDFGSRKRTGRVTYHVIERVWGFPVWLHNSETKKIAKQNIISSI